MPQILMILRKYIFIKTAVVISNLNKIKILIVMPESCNFGLCKSSTQTFVLSDNAVLT